MHDSSVFEFVTYGELAETIKQLLSLSLSQTKGRFRGDIRSQGANSSEIERYLLQQAREYLSTVREGFMLSTRTTQSADRVEMRYLLEQVLVDWGELSQQLGLQEEQQEESPGATDNEPIEELEPVRNQLIAFGMAVVALGQIPRLPSEQITFPHSYGQPPTYSDIAPPTSPGELLWRIEEIEQMCWRLMADDPGELVRNRYGPLRRTYGFLRPVPISPIAKPKGSGSRRRS